MIHEIDLDVDIGWYVHTNLFGYLDPQCGVLQCDVHRVCEVDVIIGLVIVTYLIQPPLKLTILYS